MLLGKHKKHNADPSKVEVGEIDTSSPFESVKHAVSLFGAVAFTRKRPHHTDKKRDPHPSEKISVKETRLHLAEKDLNRLKERLQNAEITKGQALAELNKARKTISELNSKLLAVSKSKDSAAKEIEKLNDHAIKVQEQNAGIIIDETSSSWKQDVDTFRVQYMAAALELNAAKQELGKLGQEYETAMRSNNVVLRHASEAKAAKEANKEATIELTGKILSMKESIEHAKSASELAREEEATIEASREILRQYYKAKLAESTMILQNLKREPDPDLSKILQIQLESIVSESEALKEEVVKAKDSYSDCARMLDLELNNAKTTLLNLKDEEISLRSMIESLKLELQNVNNELQELNKKESETKNLLENMEAELQKGKLELDACMIEESKMRSTCDEMMSNLGELSTETKKTRQEAKDIRLETEQILKEADTNKPLIIESESKLQLLLQEAEAARSAEIKALEEIKLLSERKDPVAKVTLSKEAFNTLKVKIKDSATIADMKVSVAMVQIEAVRALQNESQKILELRQKELEEIRRATADALNKAGADEAGTNASEQQLVRFGQQPHKASKMEIEPFSSPEGIIMSRSKSGAPRRRVTLGDILKMDREQSLKAKRGSIRSLSGIFHRM